MLAQGAVNAIRTGCEYLQQGKAVIDEFKGEAEGVASTVRESIETVTGLWGWFTGLFAKREEPRDLPSATVPAALGEVRPVAKKKKQPERELSYEEYKAKAIHDVCEHLKVFFEVQRQLKAHCRELEEQSLTTDRIADSAIDRIEIETQLVELSRQIREAMSWTPESLGLQDMYQRFLQMYNLILEEQEFERQRKQRAARYEEAKRWQLKSSRTDRLVYALAVVLMVIWMWSFLYALTWQQRMQINFWLD